MSKTKTLLLFAAVISNLQFLFAQQSCGCLIQPDSTFTLAMQPNDDGSTGLITLPFNFCYYGDTITGVYINNNGNISFGSTYGTFTASGFPSNDYNMIAPFWADIDTRGAGRVWYKVTSSSLIILWDSVGYYSTQTDKRNTFQLIISNGNDTLIQNGNISFCYGDMQWTTGSASGGVSGFGGEPATTGVNKGDGINYFQIARFDHAGIDYDGAYNNADGISFLDNKYIQFDVCPPNIPPIAFDEYCDTLILMAGDTAQYEFMILAPEINQSTSSSLQLPQHMTIIDNPSGNSCKIVLEYIPTNADVGINVLSILSTDDGLVQHTKALEKYLKVVYNPTLGINESESIKDMSIFPNPATTQLTITGYTPAYLTLCNTLGQTVAEASNTNTLWLGALPQGLYLLQVYGAKGALVKTEKVVKE